MPDRRPLERTILRDWRRYIGEGLHDNIAMRDVIDAAVPLMTRLGLGSYDAIHIATAARLGCALLTHDRYMTQAATGIVSTITLREDTR